MKEFMQFFSQSFTVFSGVGEPGSSEVGEPSSWRPLIDIYECRESLHILVELPGIDRDKLSVSVQDGVLRIAGYRPKSIPLSTEHVHQMEIPYGNFARYVRLPQSSDVNQINAKYENGYLIIEIPRTIPDER